MCSHMSQISKHHLDDPRSTLRTALQYKASRLNLCNPDMWAMRVSIADGLWYRMCKPRLQHLVHAQTVSAIHEKDHVDVVFDAKQSIERGLYDVNAWNSCWREEVEYWYHLAHDDTTVTELVFSVAPETLHEHSGAPLRWHVGDTRPCIVDLLLQLPMMSCALADSTLMMELQFSMDMNVYDSAEKSYHYLMTLNGGDYIAEMECESRADNQKSMGYYYHPTQIVLHINTNTLVCLMAAKNGWFAKYLQTLGILPPAIQ